LHVESATQEALEAVKRAAERAAERCDMESGSSAETLAAEIKWSALSMLADQLDCIIRDVHPDFRV